MGEASIMHPNLTDQQHFRLSKINKVKDYFIAEIRERELMSKKIAKYIAFFDSFDKSLIVYLQQVVAFLLRYLLLLSVHL